MASDEPAQTKAHLESAVAACSDRCLYRSAKWAAELLNSCTDASDNLNGSGPSDDSTIDEDAGQEPDIVLDLDPQEARLQRLEHSRYLLAKSLFDCHEYDRCAATLLPSLLPQQPLSRDASKAELLASPGSKARSRATPLHRPPPARPTAQPRLSQKSLFLALYAKYMAGEKRKEEDSEMILGPADGPITMNKELPAITSILEKYFNDRGGLDGLAPSDGFLEYLFGVILLRGKNDELAKRWLMKSITSYAWNWAAWQELADSVGSVEELNQLAAHLPPNVPALLFHIYCSQELFQSSEHIHDRLTHMMRIFPTSAFLLVQRALVHYHAKEYDEAETIFSRLMISHPYRLDSLDAYSNILYVMEGQRPKLAYLAAVASATDKFRPETCCIIGNYYSKCSEHEKAVMYFRRALTLDRSFLSAWTLMGHEYIELKNTQAAIESYRRAVDANKKDYRAWHGLGLGYELLDMHSYALFYYQRAAALQPYDAKMWMAVANTFDRCGKTQSAIRTYRRALAAGSAYADPTALASSTSDPLAGAIGGACDTDILYQLALLYERAGEHDEAAAYMELTLAQEEGPDEDDVPAGAPPAALATGVGVTQTTSKARLWLARWSFSRAEWQRATELANELCQDGVEVEEAKALIRDVRARLGGEIEGVGVGVGAGAGAGREHVA